MPLLRLVPTCTAVWLLSIFVQAFRIPTKDVVCCQDLTLDAIVISMHALWLPGCATQQLHADSLLVEVHNCHMYDGYV